jgi:hypothetical protein
MQQNLEKEVARFQQMTVEVRNPGDTASQRPRICTITAKMNVPIWMALLPPVVR